MDEDDGVLLPSLAPEGENNNDIRGDAVCGEINPYTFMARLGLA
jgi:hypothetical protein